MGTFYNGAHLRIDGTAPAGSSVLIVIEGSERDEFFDRKGRVGPIWLTVDKIHIMHAPSVFLRFGSASLGSLLDRDEIKKYRLDEDAIAGHCRFLCHCKCSSMDQTKQSGINDTVPDSLYSSVLISDFLMLKKREGNYQEHPGTVRITSAGAETSYNLDLDWPRTIAPGSYQVTVYACRGRKVVARSAATLCVEEVGFPAYMSKLAEEKPWEYGVVAALAAILAGFLTDVFTSKLRTKRKSAVSCSAPDPGHAANAPPDEVHESEVAHEGQ